MLLLKGTSKLIMSYFLSHLLIFSLPVIVFGSILYQNAVIQLQKEIESSNLNKLSQVRDMTDMRLREFGNIAAKISFDPRLTPFMLRHDPYSVIEAVSELGKYKALSGLLEDVLLYFRGDPIIYSPGGVSDLKALTQHYYRFEHWKEQQFVDEINHVAKPVIRPVENVTVNYEKQRILTYLFPIKEVSPYGTVIMLIREENLTGLIDPILGNYTGSVMILDSDKKLVASNHRAEVIAAEALLSVLPDSPNERIQKAKIGDKAYSLTAVHSELTDWTFVTIMPTEQFLSRVIEKKTFILLMVLLLLLTGLGTASVVAFHHYRPIRNLINHAIQSRVKTISSGVTEFEFIRSAIDETLDQNRDLQLQIEAQKPIIRERILLKLLKGSASEFELEEEKRALEQAHSPESSYFIMLVSAEDQQEKMIDRLSSVVLPGGHGYGVDLFPERMHAFLINMEKSNNPPEKAQRVIAQYMLDYFKANGIFATLAIGKTCDQLLQINRSYIEASAAMEYRFKLGRGRTLFFDDIHTLQDENAWYPIEEQIKFMQSVKQGDQSVALEALNVMLYSILQREQSMLLLKFMCMDMINAFFKVLNDMNMKTYYNRINDMITFDSLNHLHDQMAALVREVCAQVQQQKRHQQTQIRDDILGYLKKRYMFNELTLEEVADRFKLSPSYLSRLIKNVTGGTFTEYISGLRLEEVKRELIQTTKPIKDIILQTGYLDVSTFMRKFKKQEGVTPGEYRKLHSTEGKQAQDP